MNNPAAGPSFVLPLPALTDALKALDLTSSRPNVPVLGAALLETTDTGTVRMSAYDYDTAVSVEIAAAVAEPGRIAVDRRDLTRIVKAATKGESKRDIASWPVTVTGHATTETHPVHSADRTETCTQHTADVTIGDFTVPVTCHLISEFPKLPKPVAPTFTVARDQLAEAWTQVTVATTDQTLPVLTSIKLDMAPGRITMTGTDRFRLAVASLPVTSHVNIAGALVPAATVKKAWKVLAADVVTVGIDDKQATFHAGDVTVTIHQIPEKFPRTEHLMPTDADTTVTVNRGALVKAAGKAHALATDTGSVLLTVNSHGLTVTPTVEDQQRAKGAVLAGTVDGEPPATPTRINGRFLLDALTALTGDSAAIGFTGPNKPVIVAADRAELFGNQSRYRHLVMPMKIEDTETSRAA